MAYALIANTIKGSADTTAVTSDAIVTTAADILFVVLGRGQHASTPVISDSKSNSWTKRTTYSFSSGLEIAIYYSIPTSVGSGHTFQATNGGNVVYPAIAIQAFGGGKQTTPYDVENGASNFGTTSLATGSVTPSEDNEILISAAVHNTSTAATIDLSFTRTDSILLNGGGGNYGLAMAYLIETTATAKNPTWTGSGIGAVTIATFKAAAGASPAEETIVRTSICIPVMR